MPLSRLLGGTRTRVPTGISLGIQPAPALLVERAVAAVAAGYDKIKLKIQPGAGRRVRARRARRASAMTSRSWPTRTPRTRSTTPTTSLQLDAFELLMLEQPFGADDLVRHAELQRRMTTPICLDESITTSIARAT